MVGGLVPPGPSGMRDYGDLVARELCARGLDSEQWWLENDGVTVGSAVTATVRLLRRAMALPPRSVVLWNYSPFAYALRGLPLPGVLLGLVLRSRHIPVITVLHEIAYPWGPRGLVGRLFSVAQHAALVPVLAGSTAFVVTTAERARFVRRYRRLRSRPPVEIAPVFSTLGQHLPPSTEPDEVRRIGVVGYSADGAQPKLFFDALRHLRSLADIRVVLLGAPGRQSPQGVAWMRAAQRAGLEEAVEFTGVLSPESLGHQIDACDLITLVDGEGPSSRRTMLAAALAHGRPVIATDGPNRWDAPIREGALGLVPPVSRQLGAAIQRLCDDPEERTAMSALAFKFYEREMSVNRTCDVLYGLIAGVSREARRRRRRF